VFAHGKYRLGLPQNCVTVEFAMEAKCYARNSGVGVKAVSRLISRLRQRQFGILVTTSYLADQASSGFIRTYDIDENKRSRYQWRFEVFCRWCRDS
jgi:hypothetical protein